MITGKFIVSQIRDGKVVKQFECENKIVTRGQDAIIDVDRDTLPAPIVFQVDPTKAVVGVFQPTDGPSGVSAVAYMEFPEPIEVWSEDSINFAGFERAAGDMICDLCGKPYFDHGYTSLRDHDDRPFLKELCDGRVVKL